jgi:hypothetical protein
MFLRTRGGRVLCKSRRILPISSSAAVNIYLYFYLATIGYDPFNRLVIITVQAIVRLITGEGCARGLALKNPGGGCWVETAAPLWPWKQASFQAHSVMFIRSGGAHFTAHL